LSSLSESIQPIALRLLSKLPQLSPVRDSLTGNCLRQVALSGPLATVIIVDVFPPSISFPQGRQSAIGDESEQRAQHKRSIVFKLLVEVGVISVSNESLQALVAFALLSDAADDFLQREERDRRPITRRPEICVEERNTNKKRW
ncbi:hypothetical protein KUCAC02_013366, partial [Chaenocephalus aceratus]